jgi:AAA15 family ATPase/GTPase
LKIKSLHIKNFKSIVDLTINEPNPFTVFVGPNGGGKSNIFEALEFFVSENSFF